MNWLRPSCSLSPRRTLTDYLGRSAIFTLGTPWKCRASDSTCVMTPSSFHRHESHSPYACAKVVNVTAYVPQATLDVEVAGVVVDLPVRRKRVESHRPMIGVEPALAKNGPAQTTESSFLICLAFCGPIP